MILFEQILISFAEAVVDGIRENIRNKQVTPFGSMESTGAAADSIFYTITDERLIIGSRWAYITVLEDGRKPGKFAPPEVIEEWIDDKPVIPNDISKKSLGYLINKSLKENGSLLYQQGGNSGILSEFTSQEYVHEHLTLAVKDATIKQITSILFKKAA